MADRQAGSSLHPRCHSSSSSSWRCEGTPKTHLRLLRRLLQGCVFTRDVNQAMAISDAMETGTVQV